MIDYLVCDASCESNAHRAYHHMTVHKPQTWADPFLQWVADLGRREGEFLRDRANIARWGAGAA